ncbi:hypothetical protein BDZ89DRAFT_1170309 [Hymenopellis radicata]|nr:hypothetical protein BDZ89DRAFT_1170309 [Hymenopellis radicata]
MARCHHEWAMWELPLDESMLLCLQADSMARLTVHHIWRDYDTNPNRGPTQSQADLAQGFVGPWLGGGVIWSLTLTLWIVSCRGKPVVLTTVLAYDVNFCGFTA